MLTPETHRTNLGPAKSAGALPVQKTMNEATIPTRNHPDDAGLDLYAAESTTLLPAQPLLVSTGIAAALPTQTVGLILDRSSMAKRGIKTMGGVIDAGYRGEIKVILMNQTNAPLAIQAGDKIAQLVILPIVTPAPLETDELDKTSRGIQGFGSSGR